MGFGALRSIIIRPASRVLFSTRLSSVSAPVKLRSVIELPPASNLHICSHFSSSDGNVPFFQPSAAFDRLTDTRLPKRRPSTKSRRKRVVPKLRGAAAWTKYLTTEQEIVKKPNKGSVKRRNEKKRIKLHRAFILAEKTKRTSLVQAAKRRKEAERVERKMASVARERAWAQRLIELQQMEKEKKAAMA